MSQSQIRITEEGPLLTPEGTLAQRGWATQLLLQYDRSRIKASKLRIKEWDYYLVQDSEYALAFTIGDMGYITLVSASLLDFSAQTFITESTMGVLPLGKLNLPASSAQGVTKFADKRADMCFTVADGMRHLCVTFNDFKDGAPLVADIVLDEEPRDTMVIATPWSENPHAFYYNQKIIAMRAIGTFELGGLTHSFDESEALGLLDWGRGVWTYDNKWYWMAAQGYEAGHRIGFNLGYGFGDTAAASENMFFLDGVCHKLDRVSFGIPVRDAAAKTGGEYYDLMAPWHFVDNEKRLDLVFTPTIDRADFIDFKVVISDQHQVFGLFNGWVVLDDGTRFEIHDLLGAAEAIHNKY